MGYTAIGFDYGGVIAGYSSRVYGNQVSQILGVDFETYRDAYYRRNKDVQRGQLTWPAFWKLLVDDFGQPDKLAAVLQADGTYHAALKVINPPMIALADQLHELGYKTGLLSNNTKPFADHMREQKLDKHFDAFDISEETGYVKPEPAAFEHLMSQLDVKPNEFIFIDDSEKSLSTADGVGFTSVLFETYDKLMADLNRLGVKV